MGNDSLNDLYQKLLMLYADSFPKRCSNCGKVYEDIEEFVGQTETLGGHSGLKQSLDDDRITKLVELFRNCSCGSTLLEFFKDRRDDSEIGRRRRQAFDEIVAECIQQGWQPETARAEALKLFRGGVPSLTSIASQPPKG